MRLSVGTHVLVRASGAVQVGVRNPLLLTDLTPAQRTFVESLEGASAISPADIARHATVMDRLSQARLLDASAASPARPPRAVIDDAGPIGLGIAIALARSGWSVRFEDPGKVVEVPRGTYDLGSIASTRQAAAADTLKRLMPDADVGIGATDADVWTIVAHGAPRLESSIALMASDVPHLYITTDERGAHVGPLVMPGVGACGMCFGLARAAADPEWPHVALQLAARAAPARCSSDVAASIAGLVAGCFQAWRDDHAETWLDAVWWLDAAGPPHRQHIQPHADCGCGATGPIGDELAAKRARMR